jgi:hypothetical protein
VHPPRWGRFFWARNTSISAGAEQSIILTIIFTIIRSLGGFWLPAHFSKGSTYGLSFPQSWGPFLLKLGAGKSAAGKSQI